MVRDCESFQHQPNQAWWSDRSSVQWIGWSIDIWRRPHSHGYFRQVSFGTEEERHLKLKYLSFYVVKSQHYADMEKAGTIDTLPTFSRVDHMPSASCALTR